MRRPRTLLALGLFVCFVLVAGYGYWQFTKEVDAMTSVTLPTFESGFSRTATKE